MMTTKTTWILFAMMLLVITMVSAAPPQELFASSGYTLEIISDEIHEYNNTYPVHLHLYDTEIGVPIDNITATCEYHLYDENSSFTHLDKGILDYDDPDFETYIGAGNFTTPGKYSLLIWCVALDDSKGGFKQTYFVVEEEQIHIGVFGLWKPVEDWTFPVIYLLITILLIILALNYDSSILGVLGSIMLIFSYFLVGATSPVLFTPLLIVGFLLAFRFATL